MKKNKTVFLKNGDMIVAKDGILKSGGKLLITIPKARKGYLTNCIDVKLVHENQKELELGTFTVYPIDKRKIRVCFNFMN